MCIMSVTQQRDLRENSLDLLMKSTNENRWFLVGGDYLSKSRFWDILIYSVDIDGIGNPPIYVAVSGNGLFPPI